VPDQLQFSSADLAIAENGGVALVTVTRSGTGVGRVALHYETADDTAVAGSDYTATSGTLIFESGEMTKSIAIPILSDRTTETNETFKVTLSRPGGIVDLGSQTTAVVSITAPLWPWQNARNRFDVTDDGFVVPQDALVIINELNTPAFSGQGGKLPAPPSQITRYYDVTGDGFVAPLDALSVINFLNDRPAAEAEVQEVPSPAITELQGPLEECKHRTTAVQGRRSNRPAVNPPSLSSVGPIEATNDLSEDLDFSHPSNRDYCDLVDSVFAETPSEDLPAGLYDVPEAM
jgi:hypothetical protein